MHQSSSRGSTAPLNVARSKSYQVHTEKVAKHEGREAVAAWDDKRSTAMKSSPTGNKLLSGAAVSVNAPLIKERGARQPGLASPLYDDHAVAPPHFNGTQTRAEGREPHIHIATGETVDALIDALFQIGDYEECDSVASLGTPLPLNTEVGLEKATEDKPMKVGEKEKKTKKRFTGAREEVAARRAWEDVKRRVMHVEEYGALAPDDVGDADAMDHDAERASREFRARRRRGWAEEAIRGRAREEAGRGATAKKRRRHAILSFFFGIHGLTHFYPLSQYARRM